ncbi:hypothetical protein JZ751_013621, partial [Albula glossodonta]
MTAREGSVLTSVAQSSTMPTVRVISQAPPRLSCSGCHSTSVLCRCFHDCTCCHLSEISEIRHFGLTRGEMEREGFVARFFWACSSTVLSCFTCARTANRASGPAYVAMRPSPCPLHQHSQFSLTGCVCSPQALSPVFPCSVRIHSDCEVKLELWSWAPKAPPTIARKLFVNVT